MEIVWTSDLNTEIEVIDNQHKRIVDYINRLKIAIEEKNRILVEQVLADLVDYTQSHFAFEESLLEEVNYPHSKPHKVAHELFIKHLEEYQEKHDNGANVAEQVHAMLATWLLQHIKKDDMAYVPAVRASIRRGLKDMNKGNWLSRSLEQFFKPIRSS